MTGHSVLDVGEQIAGYRIESIVGSGATGSVYRATQLSAERPVALKVLPTTVASDTVRDRIRRAARHATALDHDHIIPVYEAGEAGDLMFVAMLLVEGVTLADRIDDRDLPGREALSILAAIASGLDAAHGSRLAHGDIKPSNILLREDGHAYLADFGMTTSASRGSAAVAGASAYVAPEQLAGQQVTAASDVYSLAAVLFECLSGVSPLQRDGFGLPPELDEVLARGMAVRPSRRYATAGALIEASTAVLERLAGNLLDRAPALTSDSSIGAARSSGARPAGAGAAAPPAEDVRVDPAPAPPLPAPPLPGPPPAAAPPAAPPAARPQPRRRRSTARPGRPRVRRAGVIAGGAVLLLAPLLLGYALGRDEAPPPAPEPTRSATSSVTMTVPPGWSRGRFDLAGLDLAAPIGLRRAGGIVLVAGRLRDPAAGLDPTRKRLRATFARARSEVVRIGSRSGLRYAGELRGGGRAWVVLLPDSVGWTAVACRAAGAADLDAICGSLAGSLRPVGATAIELSPDEALGDTLRAELAMLSRQRAAALAALRSRRAAARARAAATLASATSRASRALREAAARPQDQPLVAKASAALAAEARSLARLAAAARRGDRSAYRRHRRALAGAARATGRALRGLGRGGYDVSVEGERRGAIR